MGVHADGGLKNTIFQNYVLAQSRPPKAPFGVKICGTDAEKREESKKKLNIYKKNTTKLKNTNKWLFFENVF